MKKLVHVLFRLLFGLSLIGLGIKFIYEVNKLEPYVTQTIEQVQHKILKKDLNILGLKEHSNNIVFAEAFLLLATGLFTIFGFRIYRLTGLLAVFIELALVHNPYFYREPKHLLTASAFLSLFGALINF